MLLLIFNLASPPVHRRRLPSRVVPAVEEFVKPALYLCRFHAERSRVRLWSTGDIM